MDCNWELEKDGKGDHIMIICFDNAGHRESDQTLVGIVIQSKKNIYPGNCRTSLQDFM